MGVLLAIVVAMLLYGTLYPFHFDFGRAHGNPFLLLLHAWPVKLDRFLILDAAMNVALFVPLGVAAFLTIARRHGRMVGLMLAILVGTTLSASVEMLQLYEPTRYCSALDWLCDTAGALVGAIVALAFQPRIASIASSAGRRGAPAALLLAACWAGAQLYPAMPQLGRTHLRLAWLHLIATHVSAVEVFDDIAGWFVFALVLRAVWGRLPATWLAMAMLAIPLRLFLPDRAVTRSDVAAGVLALLLWSITPDRARQGAAWLLLLVAIVLRELAPFNFIWQPQPFLWIPFIGTMSSASVPAIAVILRKAFEYGAMIWLLRSGKVGYLSAGIALAIALAVMEALQCFLPGRIPEITDAILALLMAVVLRLLDST